jgi:hypothetical protein
MMHGSRYGTVVRNGARRLLLTTMLAGVCGLQGCATSLETFGLGAGVGFFGTIGLLTCAIGCH